MQNKIFKNIIKTVFIFNVFIFLFTVNSFAADIINKEEDIYTDNEIIENQENMISEDESANSVMNYNSDGSLFQQITDLEQEKVLMKLEKERAELDLELDRLTAEKYRLSMELDDLVKQNQEPAEEELKDKPVVAEVESVKEDIPDIQPTTTQFNKKYKLINITGAGTQLESTIQNLVTGQQRKISVGVEVDGYIVTVISLYDGVVFESGDEKEVLNIGANN